MTRTDRFRNVMGHFATGVAVVTGVDPDGRRFGFTANALTSVSLDPLLVLVSVGRESTSLPGLLASGGFALSFLAAEDAPLAGRFAGEERAVRFAGLELKEAPSGSPVLSRALAWVDCRLWKRIDAGDHVLLLGEVLECEVGREGSPLVFFRGRYGSVDT